MIDVPVEVKDALRDGRLKKNYRVVVLWQYTDVYEIYSSHESFTATITATYLLYNKTMAHAFRYVEVMPASGGASYSINCPDDPDKTWLEFPLNAGDSIYVANDIDDYVTLAVSDKNSTTEDFTIDNNNLVSESMSIDERMCSGDKIKFGLCEGSSMEFQYFGFPSIQGKRLQVFCDVDYGADNPYTIPMGFFDVKKCSRQASTGIIKATCYNKLQSDYLDANANDLINEIIAEGEQGSDKVSLNRVLESLLSSYSINELEETESVVTTTLTHGYNVFTFRACDSSGVDLGYYHAIYTYSISYNDGTLNSSDYYRFISNSDYIKSHIESIIANRYFKSGDRVLSLYDFACGSYSGDTNISGFLGVMFANNPISVKPIYKILTVSDGYTTDFYTNLVRDVNVSFPVIVENSTSASPALTDAKEAEMAATAAAWMQDEPMPFSMYKRILSDIELIKVGTDDFSSDVTLRELQSAAFEIDCQFGQLSRLTDLFSGVELNHSRLYPQETLYPDNALYPDGAQASATKSMYSKLWADEGNVHKWRNLIITYKGLDDQQQEQDFVYTAEINSDGTDDYVCSDNWLFRNLVWTQAQIEEYADTMVSKMQDMTWFPFEMWCAGLPYLETGDEIEIPMGQSTYTSYVLQRQLKGIQNLQDTYINGTLDIF